MTDASGANVSSWGGAVLLNDDARPTYHMWASEMAEGCGIEAWQTNSRIVHATSADGVHFRRREVVFDTFAHEPTVARAPTGEWVMWFTGMPEGKPPPPRCMDCTGGNTPANTTCAGGYQTTGPTYLSWSKSPDGPWTTPQRLFAAQSGETNLDTNLAAVILSNGSVVGIGRTGGDPTGIIAHLVTAADWSRRPRRLRPLRHRPPDAAADRRRRQSRRLDRGDGVWGRWAGEPAVGGVAHA
jgi:hypothetical protein